VTLGATHILVRTAERECGPLFVIKERRLPLHAVVALGAACHIRFGELLPVNVLMAILALRRRGLEIRIDQLGLQVRRLVAVDARRDPMRTQQRKLCLRMVEP